MAEPHLFVTPSGTGEIDLAALARGFVEPSFSVDGTENALGEVAVDRSTATYTSNGDAGIDYFTVSVEDSEGSTWKRRIGVAVFDRADDVE
jgi:hypothetical protein